MTRLRQLVAAVALLSVLAITVAGCSFIPSYSTPSGFRAASLVPGDTWLFSAVTLRPSLMQMAHARVLADAFTSQPGFDAAVGSAQSALAGPRGRLDLASDILPLIDGEVATAAFGRGAAGPSQPAVLFLAHSTDPDKLVGAVALAVGEATRAEPGPRGAAYYVTPRGRTLGAAFNGWALVADGRAVLDQTVERIAAAGTGGLAEEPRFRSVVERLPDEKLGFQYVDLGPILQASLGGSPDLQAPLGELDARAAVSVAARSDGVDIRLEGTSSGLPADVRAAYPGLGEGDALAAFERLPSGTLVAYGADVSPLLTGSDEVSNAVVEGFLRGLARADVPRLDLHLSRWLAGPFALGAARGSLGVAGGQPDLFLVAAVGDAAAARRDLDALVPLFPPKSVAFTRIAGERFAQASVGSGHLVTYGVADDWLYAVSGEAEPVITAHESGGLTANPRFALLQQALGPDPINLFADLEGVRLLGEELLDEEQRSAYEAQVRPFVAPLAFLGGGSRTDDNGDSHGHFFLAIRRP